LEVVSFTPSHSALCRDSGQVVHTCPSVFKHYSLVLAKGKICYVAGKVTTGLTESSDSLRPVLVTCLLTTKKMGFATVHGFCQEWDCYL